DSGSPRSVRCQPPGTPRTATGPRVGSSSAAWSTPAGVSTSSAFGAVAGSAVQIGAVPPAAQRPNVYCPAVGVNGLAWSGELPSCPVSTTANVQPGPGVPNAAFATLTVM